MKTMLRVTSLLMVLAAALAGAGCGDDATGPSENEEGWNEFTVDGVTFEWQVVDSLSELRCRVAAPTSGWVAVGFDPVAFMSEANLIIGYVSGSTTAIRDDWGTGQVSHAADTTLGGTDDVEIIDGSESTDPVETQIEFSIPMDSGDDYDKPLVEGNTYTFIFAYGADGADDFTSVHVYASSASFEL